MKQNVSRSAHTGGIFSFPHKKTDASGAFSQHPDEYPISTGDCTTSDSSRPQVLVAGDNATVLKTMAAMFREIGYHVCTAYGSAKALLYFGKSQYDLVFTDHEMNVLDGYHLAHIVKKHSSHTKVIIMTGYCRAELTDYMNDGGVDGWLFKPFCLKDLDEMLASIGLPSEYIIERTS